MNYNNYLWILFFVFILCGCKSKRERVAEYCNNHQYSEAYLLASDNYSLDKYIVKEEAIYLLETGGIASLVKIAYLLDEHGAKSLYLDLLKVAISTGNEELATKLYKMSDECDEQCVNYAITSDMESLVYVFLDSDPSLIDKENVKDYLEEKGCLKKKQAYLKVKKRERERQALYQKLESLMSQDVKGQSPPNGLQGYYLGSEMLEGSYCVSNESNVEYYVQTKEINTKLDNLLISAVKIQDLTLCNEIIKSYRNTIEITLGSSDTRVEVDGIKVDGNHSYIKYTSDDKNAAKKRLDEAKREGCFN